MYDDARELALLLVSWALPAVLCFGVIVFDERGMDAERLATAWPPASRTLAVLMFGPLAVIFHFARTRGSFRSLRGVARRLGGFAMGLALAAAALVVSELVISGLAWALGVPL